MRPDIKTRQCNEVKERVGAALSKKTETSGPSASPNKRSKLEMGIMQRNKGMREATNVKRQLPSDFADD
jgi:hypothetical protein